jgi:thiazole tautomerase (transcriptional regulator TenI)
MTKRLHIISTGQQSIKTFVHIVRQVHEYADIIQIREKQWTAKGLSEVINALIVSGVPRDKIIVNDRVDVAHIMNTGGVQLGYQSAACHLVRRSFENMKIGCSVHALKGAIAAEKEGASYLLYGHIFPTASKPGLTPWGPKKIREITEQVKIPVIAIGGITPTNTAEVLAAGASGIAVLSGILLADDPIRAARQYRHALDAKDR